MNPEGEHEIDMCWEEPFRRSMLYLMISSHNLCLDIITIDISNFRSHVFTINDITSPMQRKWFEVTARDPHGSHAHYERVGLVLQRI
jgi:hypothetical protein